MLTADPNSTITLNKGDRIVLERGGARSPVQGQINPEGGEFRIRLLKDGKDAGLVTYTDDKGQERAVTLNNENATLTLVGDGKNASIEIPSTVGINAADYIPRLNIQTDNPVTVTGGGAFIQASESTQTARVVTTSLNVTGLTKNKDNTFSAREDLLTEDKEKSMLFKLMQDQSTTTLKVESESAGIQFIDKNGEGAELFLLNGKEPMNENLARLDALQTTTKRTADTAWKENDAATQKKLGTPRTTPQTNTSSKKDTAAPTLSLEERQKVRASGEAIINELAGIRNMRVDSSKDIKLRDLPEFKPLLDDVGKAAKSFSDGAPTADKIKTLDDAIDKLSEQAETLSNRGVKSSLKKELKNLKSSYGDIRELSAPKDKDKKTGYGGTLPDNVRSAALAAVDPMIRTQKAESRTDGSPDAPITARNSLPTGSNRTV
ncbi:MAG: hypothetical protein ACK502_06540 [Alphaproteobacteria bacterium]